MYGLQRVCRLGEQKLMKNLSENNLRGSKLAEFILLCSFLCR